jgi:hypothetical protein
MTPKVTIICAGLVVGLAGAWVAASPHPATATDARGDLSPVLIAANTSVIERVVAKQEVTAALLRGELTLAQAAARFRAVNGANPDAIDRLRPLYPDAGEDELAFRQVFHFAYRDHRVPPGVVAARLPQLEAEFRAHFPAARPLGPMTQTLLAVR